MDRSDSESLHTYSFMEAERQGTGQLTDVEAFDSDPFRRLVELIDAVPYIWDIAAKRYTYIAPQVVDLLGFPADAWLHENFLMDRVAPSHRTRLQAALREFAANPKDTDSDFCFVGADGRQVWIRDIGRLISESDGRQVYLGVMIDITSRRTAEQAVRDSQTLLQSVLDAMPASINVKDLNGRYVLVNRAYADRHDKAAAAFIGRTADEMFDRSYVARTAVMERAVLDTHEPTGFHERMQRRADGTYETWLATKVPLLDASGNLSHVAGIALNISDRKHAQDALEKSEAKYRAIVESQTELVTRNSPDGALTYANKAYLDYFQVTPEQVLGCSVLHHIPMEELPHVEAHLESLTPERPTITGENRSRSNNGEIRWQFWTDRGFFDETGRLVEIQSVGRDITDLKNAQRALQISEERHRRLVESANVIPFAINLDTMKFVYAGPQIGRVLGYPVDKFVDADSWTSCIHPDDRTAAIAGSVIGKPDQPSHTLEYRMIAADGRIVWIREYSTNERSEDGSWFEYGLVFDISEQKRTELALQQSESKYRAIVEDQTEFVVRYLLDGTMTFVNPAYCRYFGLPESQLLGRSWYSDVPEAERMAIQREHERVSIDAPVIIVEHRCILPNGEVRWESWTNRGIFNEDGQILAFQSIGRDITDKKIAEERLRENELRFRHLVESTDVVPYALEIESGRFTYIGPQAVRLLGYATEEWTDEKFWQAMLLPDERDQLVAQWNRIKNERGYEIQEYRVQRKDGAVIWIRDVIRIEAGSDGRHVAYGLMLDITRDKERDEQLRQAQKMDIVGQMTGGVAHDFNNLLTVIIGNLHLLQPTVVGDPKAARRLDLIRGAAERGAELTRGLLAFARRQTLQGKLTNVNALVSGMTELLRRTLGEGIQIDLRLAEDLWMTLVDPARLEAVVVNLAVNARDAMGPNGNLQVKTENVLLDVDEEGARPYILLSVTDTGCGMAPEVLSKVFEPFFTTKPVGQGTGLGLSMVYGTVKQSGGRIEIESEVGQGTSVRIYLPSSELTAVAANGSCGRIADGRPVATILLVEPNSKDRELAASALSERGYTVLEAEGGPTALSFLEAKGDGIDLLLTNVTLPGTMGGMVMAHEATKRRPHLGVLYISESTVADSAHEWVPKPYSPESLNAKVDAFLGGRSR